MVSWRDIRTSHNGWITRAAASRIGGLTTPLLLAALLIMNLAPQPGFADDDNDNERGKTEKPGTGPPSVSPSDPRPDLKIEYVGFQNPANDQLIRFRVTNVGKARSTAIKARIVTLEPEPTPWERNIDVPSLAPGANYDQVYYPLSASCVGHLVRATVDDPLDFPSVNDRVEVRVCPILPPIVPTSPDLSVDYGASALGAGPLHLQPGTHAFALSPALARTFAHSQELGDCDFRGRSIPPQVRQPLFPLVAGFQNAALTQILGDCQANGIWQAAFRFDLSELREAYNTGRASFVAAELTFTETTYAPLFARPEVPFVYGQWITPGEGLNYASTNTCWPRLARPTLDWSKASSELLPNEEIARAGAKGQFSMLDKIGDLLRFAEHDAQGFVILGHNEEMHFNNAACLSKIENVKLVGTYVVRAP